VELIFVNKVPGSRSFRLVISQETGTRTRFEQRLSTTNESNEEEFESRELNFSTVICENIFLDVSNVKSFVPSYSTWMGLRGRREEGPTVGTSKLTTTT